jgi:hypothetical protein
MMGAELHAIDTMVTYFLAVTFGGAAILLVATGAAFGVRRALAAFRPARRMRSAPSAR